MNENDEWKIANNGNWRTLFSSLDLSGDPMDEIDDNFLKKVYDTPMTFDQLSEVAGGELGPTEDTNPPPFSNGVLPLNQPGIALQFRALSAAQNPLLAKLAKAFPEIDTLKPAPGSWV